MHACKCFALMLLLPLTLGTAVFADEAKVLTDIFREGPASVSYSRQFETAVPLSSMQQLLVQLTMQLGNFKQVEGTSNPYKVVFEQGTVTAYISLDGQGNVAGLQLTEVISSRLTLADCVKQITDLDAETAVLIRKNGQALVSLQADVPLAVGSAFKLGILAALDDAVRAKRMQWGQSVMLEESYKSLPTGILQDWPVGSRITIETLATLMISQSDNTAADALLSLVSRQEVDRYLTHSKPTLSTAEMFTLKNPDNSDILARFRASSAGERLSLLGELKARKLPKTSLFSGDPVAIDVEWFMTVSELADLIERLETLDLMTVNAGLATKEHWQRVAYKGGSEPGVLNLTTFLIDEHMNRYTVVVTVNNNEKPLDEKKIMESYQAILHYLQ